MVTAGIFLASILLKEMRYLVYIRYLWTVYMYIKPAKKYIDIPFIQLALSPYSTVSYANGTCFT
jgi:hypothetical protein